MKVALAQLDQTVGDFPANTSRILGAYERACAEGAELVVFAELRFPGLPPNDVGEEPACGGANREARAGVAGRTGAGPAIRGFTDRRNGDGPGRPIYNAAALIENGEVRSVHHKALLPT